MNLGQLFADSHPILALWAVAALVGGLLAERALLHFRPEWYFTAAFPLEPELLPLPRVPEAEAGKTASVHWERRTDLVLYWSEPGTGAPMGLHGAVRLVPTPRGVRMIAYWSPPWSPLLAATWLGGLGAARQEVIVLPIACLMILGTLFVYRMFAVRAAAELRWAWVRES
jgi:hypothetical protein